MDLLPGVTLAGARRVSLRRRLADGALGDVVGHVVAEDVASLSILPEDRPVVLVARADVVAQREVPPRVVRPSSSAADVARLLATHWPGTESARLGGWLLRAGGGFTKRANSTLVVGDPGGERRAALDVVTRWYGERGVTPHLSVIGGIGEQPEDAGWEPFEQTDVLTCDLRRISPDVPADVSDPVPDPVPEASDTPTDDWLSVWRSGACRGSVERAVLTAAPARYLMVRDGAEPLACARVATGRSWAHVSCVEVRPTARGRGLARSLMAAALRSATQTGVRFAAVEVLADNEPAQRLYRSMGFVRHYRHHYRRPVS